MLRLLTGRNHRLSGALLERIGQALAAGEDELTVVVPKQLTLETELFLLEELRLQGSFRLRVLSPERLCRRIFDEAGRPEGERVDERGRVMLVARAMKDIEGELTLYRGAQARRGFARRAARQLEIFRQAGLDSADVADLAAGETGALRRKLEDVSRMLAAYENALAGRFQDGEDEFRLAAARAGDAKFLAGARLWFYGFDLMPPTLHDLIAATAARGEVTVFLPLERDENARDLELFRPLAQSAARLAERARERNASVVWERAATADARHAELRHLGSELFSYPARPWEGAPRRVQLYEARTLREEARFAAALTRRLVRVRGWRFRDVRVLVPDADAYRQPLREAFSACGVPVFLAESRPCARHALCECLLTALHMLARGLRDEDVHAYLASDYLNVSPRDTDRLRNYAVSYGLHGSAFLKPLRRGPEALREELEPVRRAAMEPLATLRERLRAAKNLRAQLEALFGFLTDIHACEKGVARQQALAEENLYELAGDEAQVWNRTLGALDQMALLLGEDRLSLRELSDRLTEALDAAVVKPLPQSGDAVYAQELTRLSMLPVKAVLLLGQVDRAAGPRDALLSDRQLEAVSARAERYVGLTAAEAARTRLFYIKEGVEMATEYVCVSYPLAGADDAAERPGVAATQARLIFPRLAARGGVRGDAGADDLLFEAPDAALARAAAALSRESASDAEKRALRALADLPRTREKLERLRGALNLRQATDRLSREAARRVYGDLRQASVTRLDLFAGCPFAHFLRYGLKPQILEPYALTARDEGAFFHAAVRGFLAETLTGEEPDVARAEARMDAVAETLLSTLREGPLGQSAVSRAEEKRLRGVTRAAARLLTEQLCDSRFRPVGLELRFGPEDGDACLKVGANADCTLSGLIDRVDEWTDDERFVRVLDYKRGTKPFSLVEAYCGLQLQLLVYLAAAAKKRGGRPVGAFYFRLDEGYVLTPETDPAAVEALRHKELRMDGPSLADEGVAAALSRDPKRFYKATSTLQREEMARLVTRALTMAGRHVDGIRSGEAQPAPARVGKQSACRFCDGRAACLFDEEIDRARVRRVREDKASVLAKLAAGEDVDTP